MTYGNVKNVYKYLNLTKPNYQTAAEVEGNQVLLFVSVSFVIFFKGQILLSDGITVFNWVFDPDVLGVKLWCILYIS